MQRQFFSILQSLILLFAASTWVSAAEVIEGASTALVHDSVVLIVPDDVSDAALTVILRDGEPLPAADYQLKDHLLVIKNVAAGEHRIVIRHGDSFLKKSISVRQDLQLATEPPSLAQIGVVRTVSAESETDDPSAALPRAFVDGLKERVRTDADKLKAKDRFIECCKAVSEALQQASNNQATLASRDVDALHRRAKGTIESGIKLAIPTDANLQGEWQTTADNVIKAAGIDGFAGKKAESFDDWIAVYRVTAAAFAEVVAGGAAPQQPAPQQPVPQQPVPQQPAPQQPAPQQPASPETATKTAAKIAADIRDPDKSDVFKNNFVPNSRAIVNELRSLRSQHSVTPFGLTEYKSKTAAAFDEAVRETIGFKFRQEWKRTFDDVVLPIVEASDELKDSTAADWDKVVEALIVGITKSAEDITKELPPSSTATEGGGLQAAANTGGIAGGTGLTPHAARKIRRITSWAAVRRARTQAILAR